MSAASASSISFLYRNQSGGMCGGVDLLKLADGDMGIAFGRRQ